LPAVLFRDDLVIAFRQHAGVESIHAYFRAAIGGIGGIATVNGRQNAFNEQRNLRARYAIAIDIHDIARDLMGRVCCVRYGRANKRK
jgi:hypothetical protein